MHSREMHELLHSGGIFIPEPGWLASSSTFTLLGLWVAAPTLGVWVDPWAKCATWPMGRPVGLRDLLAYGSEHMYLPIFSPS